MLEVGTNVRINIDSTTNYPIGVSHSMLTLNGINTRVIGVKSLLSGIGYYLQDGMDYVFTDSMLQVLTKEDGIYTGKYVYISSPTYRRIKDICDIDIKANSSISNRTVMFETDKTLNSKIDNHIFNNASGEFCIGENIKLKLGKILSTITTLNSTEIEKAVSKWKSHYDVDTSGVMLSKDVTEVYGISKVGGSCMYNKDMRLLNDLDCQVAYLLDDNEYILARALVWDNNIKNSDGELSRCHDRIFFNKEHDKLVLLKFFREAGYKDITKEPYITAKQTGWGYDSVPYLDSMCHLTADNYLVNNTDIGNRLVDCLQATDGSSNDNSGISLEDNEDKVYCIDTDSYVHIDDAYWCDSEQEYYEYNDELVWVNDELYHYESDEIVRAYDTDDYVLRVDAYYCETDDNYYETYDDLVEIDYDLYRCDDENIALNEDTDEYDFKNNMYEHSNGAYYSNPEEEEYA